MLVGSPVITLRRLGRTQQAVSKALLDGLADIEFRARLAVPLTQALTVLIHERGTVAARAADPACTELDEHAYPLAGTRTRPGLRRPGLRAPRWSHRPLAVGIAVVAVTGGAATASSLWLAPAGNPVYGYNPGLVSIAPPAAQMEGLAVLRRPQADRDRGPGVQAALANVNEFTVGVRSNYVRVLATTRNGAVVLVPVERRNASAAGSPVAQPAVENALCVYYPFGDLGAVSSNIHCWSTQQLVAGQALAGIGGHEYGLAPDGVATVRVALGAWTKSVRVAGNFFDVTLPRGSGTSRSVAGVPISPTITFSSSAR